MHRLKPFFTRSSILTAGLVILIMLGATLFAVSQLHATWHAQLERSLVAQIDALAQDPILRAAHIDNNPQAATRVLDQAAAWLGGSALITNPAGQVWTASADYLARGTDLSRMPEMRAALNTGHGLDRRVVGTDATSQSATQEAEYYFVAAAMPAIDLENTPEAIGGIIRLALPYAPHAADFRPLQTLILVAGLAATLILTALTVFFTERNARDIHRLTTFARALSTGPPEQPHLLSIQRRELAPLAQALNRISDRLKSQMKKRAREKDRLITIIHVMTDGVIILNKNGRVRLLNPAAERILHTTQSRALGRSFVQTARDHRIAAIWERCIASGKDEIAAVELGADQFVRVAVTPFLKRTARGYLVILQDLTEVRRLQTIRQDFVSNVSHELRTPLASLRALVDTLRDGAIDDPPAAHRFLDRMEVEVDALTQMVAELLELSRIESGQVPLQLARANPAQVLGIGAERLRPQTERANIALVVEIPPDLPEVMVDSTRIQQVVTNLVHNAIKFTPPRGTISMTAYVETCPADPNPGALPLPATHSATITRIVVKVKDTGTGIPQAELPRIFERFYKTDRSRAMGGTGLGLAISKHIIQLHGGKIWAESDGKSGSSFYFALPTVEDFVAPNTLDGTLDGRARVPTTDPTNPDATNSDASDPASVPTSPQPPFPQRSDSPTD
ncbi:MAG: ATP-binding protein [Litorilinea sp.]